MEQEQGWAPASYLRSFDNEDDDDDKISSNIGPSPNYAGMISFLCLEMFFLIFLHAKHYGHTVNKDIFVKL